MVGVYDSSAAIVDDDYNQCQHHASSTLPRAAVVPYDDRRFDSGSAGYCNYREVSASCRGVTRRNEMERRRVR